MLVEPSSTKLSSEEADILSELQPAGVMFRARNFNLRAPYSEWLGEYRELVADIRKAIGRLELLLTIDHEGGRVIRPPRPITRFPYAQKYADEVVHVTTAMALELKSLGINMSFSPVADIDEGCPVIRQRAFSHDPQIVKKAALQCAQTLKAHGILPVPKHFPGHGAVKEDSHFALPILSRSLAELMQNELLPFQALIDQGISALMTAHLMVPALDGEYPATISTPILVDLLRKQMKFQGVIIADALGMAAISDRLQGGSLTAAGLAASLDLFMLVGDSVSMRDAQKLAQEMQACVANSTVEPQAITDSLARIAHLLSEAKQFEVQALPDTQFATHQSLAQRLDPSNEWTQFQYIPKGF